MCSLPGIRSQDLLLTILLPYRLSYPAAYTSSPLNSEHFWTVTYSPAILKFILEFSLIHRAMWNKLKAMKSRSLVVRQMSQGEKNVQPDQESIPGSQNTILGLYRLSYKDTYIFPSLNSEQIWTLNHTESKRTKI